MDNGTENIYCKDLQVFWTRSETSYIASTSTRNQRIEASWSRLKKFKLSWWIDFFSAMINNFIHKPDCLMHKEVLLFCFMPVLQAELNEWLRLWNTRRVRKSANAPGGIPEVLFNVPTVAGFRDRGVIVDDADIESARSVLGIHYPPFSTYDDLHELLICYIHIYNLTIPRDPESGLDLYIELLQCLNNDGFAV